MTRAIDWWIARVMTAAIAAAVALAALPSRAQADFIDDESRELLGASHYKRRLAAALTLSKAHDVRAVRALTAALERDSDAKLRQIAALALAKAITEVTPPAEREAAFAALGRVTARDPDARVRELAARSLTKLEPLRIAVAAGPPPPIFVHVTGSTDGSKQVALDSLERLTGAVRGVVGRRAPELATRWPGPLPTARLLGSAGTRAYSVAPSVAAITIVQRGGSAEITCRVQLRVQPWNGVDGGEKWVAHQAASATGQGRATTSATQRAIAGGIRDCVLAVAEEVTASQVIPFLRRVVSSS